MNSPSPPVYCLEAVDQPGVDLARLALPQESELHAKHRPDLLGGMTVIEGQALTGDQKPGEFTAVPYYAWANRDKGAMAVWIAQPATTD